MIKRLIKTFLPKSALLWYHKLFSRLATWWYGYPADKLIVIGVTGTNGKSTVCNMITHVLEEAGYKVGMTTTVNFRIAGREWLNKSKMTMLGRSQLQRLLAQMLAEDCEIAVIETSSEGLAQFRHIGIAYDVAVFTNLTPEHIESHGGFENYQRAKGLLFDALHSAKQKSLHGKPFPKTIVVNDSDKHAEYFSAFSAEKKIGYRLESNKNHTNLSTEITAKITNTSATSSQFNVAGTECQIALPGAFNVENALAAIAVSSIFNVSITTARTGLAKISGVPGRMERINEGQPFTVIVDYAPEPTSFAKLYEVVSTLEKNRIIHVFGSTGGGRDRDRRPILGNIAGKQADIVIITNEDPYDDDPMHIIHEVAEGSRSAGKRDNENLFVILDRSEAIQKAINLAEPNDIVLITGKGAEQAMMMENGRKIPWDDREKVREALKQRTLK
jgi:UDP-N-acetylmuramoyl-L-alanyl-D-glutamate--2,6-diaminopimelate ligase